MHDNVVDSLANEEEGNWWNIERKKLLSNIMDKLNFKGKIKIFDLGCGPGGTTVDFLKYGQVVGTDFSFHALKYAKNFGLNVFKSNYQLPLKDKVFDIVTMLDVLEHIEDDSRILIEIKRILKEDGFLIITVPAFQFLWSEHDIALSHFRRYTISSLTSKLKDNGFRIHRTSYFFSYIFPLYAIFRILTRSKIDKKNPKYTMGGNVSPRMNELLLKIVNLETKILKNWDLPFGTSLLCIAKKM